MLCYWENVHLAALQDHKNHSITKKGDPYQGGGGGGGGSSSGSYIPLKVEVVASMILSKDDWSPVCGGVSKVGIPMAWETHTFKHNGVL